MNVQDPILKNIVSDGPYTQKLFNNRTSNKLRFQWADGVPLQDLVGLVESKKVLITNSVFKHCEPYNKNIYTANPSYYGLMYHDYQVDANTQILKNFNCFLNRFDIFRQSWFYHLVRRNWLDQGWVSFNCGVSAARAPDKSYIGLSVKEIFEKGFKENNTVFAVEHEACKHLVPYKNFEDSGDLTNFVLTSKFSIVLETWFHGNHCITFSEKTMRCLQLPRPWLLFSTQNAVQQLREWGFDVLDDVLDHSYDLLETPVQRQMAILDQAERLQNCDISTVVDRCKQASEHNKSLLRSWNQNWFINIQQDYEMAEQQAASL